jgi:hypothetical protein
MSRLPGRSSPCIRLVSTHRAEQGPLERPAIMMAMPTAEIYTLLLAGLLAAGVIWLVTRFNDRD